MRSLRTRVTLGAALAAALVLAICGLVLVTLTAQKEQRAMDSALAGEAKQAADRAFQYDEKNEEPFTGMAGTPGRFARVYAQGKVSGLVRYTGEEATNWPSGPGGFPKPRGLGIRDVEYRGRRFRELVVESSHGNPEWGLPLVQVYESTAALEGRVARVRNAAIGAGLLGTLLVAGMVWVLAGLALRPVTRAHVAAGLGDPLPEEGPAEIRELIATVNGAFDRLRSTVQQSERSLDSTRTFTADAGHELRTPLTTLRANLDVLSREGLSDDDRERALEDALRAHGRVTSLIDALQVLARGDAAVAARTDRVDLAELADAAVLDARRRHPGKDFTLDAAPQAHVTGDPDGLRMLLDNLLENAAVHGGGRIRTHVHDGHGYVRLAVDDDGPGIPDAEKRRVFDRFARGGAARNGTGSGLGLAIAAQQAELHGSRLKLEDSPLGGARFELTLSAPSSS